jgi:hypothetical protein
MSGELKAGQGKTEGLTGREFRRRDEMDPHLGQHEQ